MNVAFLGGKTYGVDDLNDTVAKLVGAGVAPFVSKDSYNYEDLNGLTEAITAQGTSLDGLKVTVLDGIVTISEGIAYFENGITVEVAEPEQFEYSGYDVYVFLKYDTSLHLATIEVSNADYDKNDTYNYYIPLAKITDSIVTDCRVYARSKIATIGTNVVEEKRFELLDDVVPIFMPVVAYSHNGKLESFYYTQEEILAAGYTENNIIEASIVATVNDIDLSKYNYVTFVQTVGETDTIDTDFPVGVYDLKKDCFLYSSTALFNTNYAKKAGYLFYVKLINGKLSAIFRNEYNGNSNYVSNKKYVPFINLIFS